MKGDMEGQQNPNEPGKSNPGQGGPSSKIARNRNVNANSVSAKNKVAASRAVGNRVVAANRVVSKADDKPGYLEKESGGRRLPPLFCAPLQSRATTFTVSVSDRTT